MDQTQRPRYVSRFEPLALHPRLHHRVGFSIHYLPPREPPPRRICYNKGVPNSSLKHRLTTEGQARSQTTTTNTSTEEGYKPNTTSHQREQTSSLNLYQRGSKPITRSTSTKEGYNKNKGVQQVVSFNHKQSLFLFSFPQKQKILIDQDRRYSSSVETKCFWKQAIKKNYQGNLL